MIIDTCNANTMRDLYETFKKIHRVAAKRVSQLSIDRIVKNARSAELVYFTFRLPNILQIVHGE